MLRKADIFTGETVWEFDTYADDDVRNYNYIRGIAVGNSTVYVSVLGLGVVAVESSTGAWMWSRFFPGGVAVSPTLTSDGAFVFIQSNEFGSGSVNLNYPPSDESIDEGGIFKLNARDGSIDPAFTAVIPANAAAGVFPSGQSFVDAQIVLDADDMFFYVGFVLRHSVA